MPRPAPPSVPVLLSALLAVATAVAATAAVDPALLAGLKARSIGPAGMSGRVAAIEAVETDSDVVYAGAATGGVWKSINGGLTWAPIFDEQPVAAIGSIAVFQANPDIVWVGTGEGNVRNSASVGNGVYKSLDGGRTWRHVGLEKSERIYRIRLHPGNPDVAWVCAPGALWGENAERGVFKTEDGGETWKNVLFVDARTGCGDLALDPSNPNKLFAGMWQFRRWPYFFRSGGPGSGLHATLDGGRTWRRLEESEGLPAGDLGRIGIAISRSNPEIVYALVEAEKSALLRSQDGGRSFQTVNDAHDVAPRPFYFCDLRVDPQWPNRVYSVDYEIRVSDDAGKTFRSLVRWDQIHGDHHALWIDPSDPTRFYTGNDGGVSVSDDRGETSRFVSNLPLAQFYHVAVDGERPYNIYGGLQDNGSWRGPSRVWSDAGIKHHEWAVVGWGDGFDVQPDPGDANLVYSMWQGGNLGRHDLRTGETRDIKPPAPDGVALRFNWNAGLAVDPHAPGTLYLGSQFVHRSTDRGETWTVLSGDLTRNNPQWQRQAQSGGLSPDVTAAENYGTILTIAPSPVERGVLWVGSDDGRVHLSRDGGSTWVSVEKNVRGVPEGAWVPHITASPHAGGTAFLVFDDHRRSDWTPYVLRTDDYGKTWKSLVTNDLRGYAFKVEQDPVRPELLFLGTEFGLWVSLDGGAKWLPFRHGVPTVSVMDLVIHPREHDLVVATHGRALFVVDDIRPLRGLDDEVTKKPLHLFPIAEAQQAWRRQEPGGFGFGSGEYRGENRPYGALVTYWLAGDELPHPDEKIERERQAAKRLERAAKSTWGPEKPKAVVDDTPAKDDKKADRKDEKKPQATIRVADASGQTVRTFEAPARQGLNRAVWGFERDAFRRPPSTEPSNDEHPSGPELPPGTYTVTVRYSGHEASQTVEVAQDPRSRNSAADWAARESALGRAGGLHESLVVAVEGIAAARRDLDILQARIDERDKAKGKSDSAKTEATAPVSEDPLTKAVSEARKALDEIEPKLWVPLKTKGIVADDDALSRVAYAMSYILSSWAPPSPTHLRYLDSAAASAKEALSSVRSVFEGPVRAARQAAVAAGLAEILVDSWPREEG